MFESVEFVEDPAHCLFLVSCGCEREDISYMNCALDAAATSGIGGVSKHHRVFLLVYLEATTCRG